MKLNEHLEIDVVRCDDPNSLCLPGRRFVHISQSARMLIDSLESTNSIPEAAQMISRLCSRPVSESEVLNACEALRQRLRENQTSAKSSGLPFGMWLRIPLFPARAVRSICGLFIPFFGRTVIWYGCGIAIVYLAFMLWQVLLSVAPPTALSDIPIAYILFIFSLLCHEFGHATACRMSGVQPSNIGFIMYLVFPAFYADVNAAWGVSREKRIMIDVAGCYIQGLVGLLYSALYVAFHWMPLRISSTAIAYSILISMMPTFRFDGYWLLVDLTGEPFLSRKALQGLRYAFIQRIAGSNREHSAKFSRNSLWIALYGAFTLLMWGVLLASIGNSMPYLLRGTFVAITDVWRTLSAGNMPRIQDVNELLLCLLSIVPVIVCATVALNRASKMLSAKRSDPRPSVDYLAN